MHVYVLKYPFLCNCQGLSASIERKPFSAESGTLPLKARPRDSEIAMKLRIIAHEIDDNKRLYK